MSHTPIRSSVSRSAAALVFSLCLAGSAVAAGPAIKLDGNSVLTSRHVFEIGPGGLPDQITIKADIGELPLEKRYGKQPGKDMTAAELAAIGRGAQLRAPMRLEATAADKVVVLAPAEPAKLAAADDGVTATSKLAGGGVTATLEVKYRRDGAMECKLAYGGGASISDLSLVMDVAGVVDCVVAGGGPADKALPFAAPDYGLSNDEGVVWGNAKAAAPAATTTPTSGPAAAIRRGQPGMPTHFFFGSGDRGFTWLAGEGGMQIDPAAACMTLTRDREGQITWRASLVNHAAKLDKEQTATFCLLVHPAVAKAADFRQTAWLSWPAGSQAPKVLPIAAASRAGEGGLLRADAAGICESIATAAVLEGIAGGDALSAQQNLADTFPPLLFRYLAGTHTGLTARLRTNVAKLVHAGQSEGCDRMAFGRALVNDIGLDAAGLANKMLAARLVTGMEKFGYFQADDKTEYLPWWRSRGVVRYGEVFTGNDSFAEHASDPMARVFVSAWRRPAPQGKRGTRAMILVVNEGNDPVRQQLYVLKPKDLFSGPNRLTAQDVIAQWDMSGIPDNSDWNRQKLSASAAPPGPRQDRKIPIPHLQDLEDNGYVIQASPPARDGVEIYGMLFVPAHGLRLLYGAMDP